MSKKGACTGTGTKDVPTVSVYSGYCHCPVCGKEVAPDKTGGLRWHTAPKGAN